MHFMIQRVIPNMNVHKNKRYEVTAVETEWNFYALTYFNPAFILMILFDKCYCLS